MDPTAPKDNPQNPPADPLSPNSGQTPTPGDSQAPPNAWSPIEQPESGGPQPSLTPDGAGPILPGQFVITGEDTPNQTQNNQATNPHADANKVPLSASAQPVDTAQHMDSVSQSVSNSTAQDQLITPPSNPPTPNPDPLPTPQNPVTSMSQPDPTPFMPPSPGSSQGGFSKPPGGGIKKLRTIILVLGIIILLMIVGAIAWFFFFANQANQAAKTENQNQSEPAIKQQPIPKRGEGGFNELQENSTPSGQLQQSTPAASRAPTP